MGMDYKINFDTSLLKQYASMFSSPIDAIIELIANSYDAAAKNVYLIFENEKIIIKDDGIGMNEEDIQNKFLSVGINKRNFNLERSSGRKYLGRKGNGRWGIFGFSKNLKLYSKKYDNSPVGLELDFIDILKNNKSPVKNEDLEKEMDNFKNGTCIQISEIITNFDIIKKNFYSEISLKLSKILNKDFNIFYKIENNEFIKILAWKESFNKFDNIFFINESSYNKEQIEVENSFLIQTEADIKMGFDPNLEELKKKRVISLEELNKNIKKKEYKICNQPLQCNAETEYYDLEKIDLNLEGWIGTFYSIDKNNDKEDDLKGRGIKVFSRGRLVIKNLIGTYINTDSFYDSYITGEIFCDDLDRDDLRDITKISRDSFIESDERVKVIAEYCGNIVRRLTNIKNNSNKKSNSNKEKKDALNNTVIVNKIKKEIFSTIGNNNKNFENFEKKINEIVSKETKFKFIDIKNKYIFISHKSHDFKQNAEQWSCCIDDLNKKSGYNCIYCLKKTKCNCDIKRYHDLSKCDPFPSSYIISKLFYDIFTAIIKNTDFPLEYKNYIKIINTSFDNTVLAAHGEDETIMNYIKNNCGLSYKAQYLAFICCLSNDYIDNFPTDIEFGSAWILDRNPKIILSDRNDINFKDPLSKFQSSLDLKTLIKDKQNDIDKLKELKIIIKKVFNENLEIIFNELDSIIEKTIDNYDFKNIL